MPSWLTQIPDLARLSPALAEALKTHGAVLTLPAGVRIYQPGRKPDAYLLVLEGSVRVQQVSEGGREIVLYRVHAGESCTLTTACLIGHDDYSAEAISETPVRAVALPRAVFDELMASSHEFRRFVFNAFSARITNLFRLVEQVAFGRLDVRLARKIVELAGADGVVIMTQQQLAAEVGTAREVVSRTLADFQRRGLVVLARGRLTLVNRAALATLAATP